MFGEHATYRGKKNAVLMYIQNYQPDFAGLVGKHSTERTITKYDDTTDVTANLRDFLKNDLAVEWVS